MRLYLASSFIFPRSLQLRLFAVCFVGTHLPLAAFLAWAATTSRLDWPGAIVVTVATLLGTVIAVGGIYALLAPIDVAARALNDAGDGEITPVPQLSGSDLAARLFAGVNRAAGATAERMRKLSREAISDPLTGVLNRRGLLQRLDVLSEHETTGALALVDMDHFKLVNDLLGHETGDRVLQDFAKVLAGTVRHTDLVARWGGEEFLVFFRGATEAQAQSVLMRIAERIRNEPLAHVGERPLTFSAGTTAASRRTLEEALRRADGALYEAKHRGRARILSSAEIQS
ncbi:diguanylate cyclase (GGDEF) domain-containing protein [Sphingomonas sp. OV641]|uniref:GGDEF domain-containing protein n=1 Tax=Sphingomonas sp. OV641 TaxID=1881068 RepID=UPI0008AF04F9|nr:GGDEF domain-containing protein [Sphingomonas sp. OV641]SEJ80730.1 diguanylate cyclase (GGDEF) domain-containing protein [Sphingomonas sp. OV641]